MEMSIAVSLLMLVSLSALMIYGIGRLCRRHGEQMLVRRPRGEIVGELDARIELKVNEKVQEMMIELVSRRLPKEKYGHQKLGNIRRVQTRLRSVSA